MTTVLAEVALPGLIRSQQAAYLSHPALLDACFQSVIVHPDVQAAGAGGLLLPVGVRRLRCYHPTRNAHYCLTRVTASRGGECEADLEVLDQSGTVLMTVEGLRLSAGGSEQERADRLLNERLLTIEWELRDLPDVAKTGAGAWLLLNTSDAADPLAAGLTDALTAEGASCTTVSWPLGAERLVDAGPLRTHLGGGTLTEGGLKGVVVVTGTPEGNPLEPFAHRGRDYVTQLVGLARRAGRTSRRAATALRAHQRRCQRAGRGPGEPGAGRAAWSDAGDRLRAPAPGRHPDRRGRRERGQAGGAAAAQRFGGRRDRLAQRRLVHRPAAAGTVAPRRTEDHRRRTRPRWHAAADPQPRRRGVVGVRRVRPGCRRGLGRSRSR